MWGWAYGLLLRSIHQMVHSRHSSTIMTMIACTQIPNSKLVQFILHSSGECSRMGHLSVTFGLHEWELISRDAAAWGSGRAVKRYSEKKKWIARARGRVPFIILLTIHILIKMVKCTMEIIRVSMRTTLIRTVLSIQLNNCLKNTFMYASS